MNVSAPSQAPSVAEIAGNVREKATIVNTETAATNAVVNTTQVEKRASVPDEQQRQAIAETEIDLAVAEQKINDTLSKWQTESVRFAIDRETGKTIIRKVDKRTGEVLSQIPPQEFLDMVSALNKVAQALLKDLPKYV